MVGLGPVFESTYFPQGATKIDPPAFVNYARRDYDLDTLLGGKERFGEQFLRENRVDILDRWLEPDHVLKYFEDKVSVGIMMPVEGRYHSANIAGVRLSDSYIDLNMRDVGRYVHMEHTFRHHLMDFMKSDEGYKLAEWLNEIGYKAKDISHIAVGFTSAIYQLRLTEDGKIIFYVNKDAYKEFERFADSDEMLPEEVREASIAEEIVHIFRSFDSPLRGIPEEKLTKEIVKRFYENLYEKTADSDLKERYTKIIRHVEGDIATIARYVKLYSEDMGKLESILEAEAIEKGITSEKGVNAYKAERLEEIADAAKEEYSESDTVGDVDAESSGVEAGAYGGVESIVEGEVCAESADSVEGDGEACAEAAVESGDGGGE